jgi:hypothetical protein
MEDTIRMAIEIAFEAGKWVGQVELEEHYDKEQYSTAIIESLYSKKNAMPIKDASNGKTIEINLRSDKWREGVHKSSGEYKQKAIKMLIDYINNNTK